MDIVKNAQIKNMDATIQKIMTHLDGYNSLDLLNIMACITGAIIQGAEKEHQDFARVTFNYMLDERLKGPKQ